MRVTYGLLSFLLLLSPAVPAAAQTSDGQITISSIDYFGYGGLDLKRLDGRLPLHPGDTVTQAGFDKTHVSVRDAITAAFGAPPTDINATCCDANRKLMIYIGLPGSSSHPLSGKAAPTGTERLDPQALRLYEAFGNAMQEAISKGISKEDWSKGYALSEDPATHAIQLQAREYALHHEAEIARTLRNAADAQQRVVAAYLMGYVARSPAQAQALADAATDSNEEVRNNAVRALSVLSASTNAPPLTLNAKPLIAMLYSGQWTDRNKSSLLFQMLTESRNPALLDQLRKQALPPLIEGARWTNLGHAQAFLIILGRIGKLSDAEIGRLMSSDREKLIDAASH